MMQLRVLEGHVSDASVGVMRCDRANRETDTPPRFNVADHNVLGAREYVILRHWLHDNCIVEVRDVDALDKDVNSLWVNAVSV